MSRDHYETALLAIQRSIQVPQVPNFIRFTDGGTVDIAQLSGDQIEAIGRLWVARLKAHSVQRREASAHDKSRSTPSRRPA